MSEEDMEKIFIKHHEQLGFTKVVAVDGNPDIEHPSNNGLGPGDYLAEKDGKRVLIEVEEDLTHFFTHAKHTRDKIDVVVTGRNSRIRDQSRRDELSGKEVIVLEEIFGDEVPRRPSIDDYISFMVRAEALIERADRGIKISDDEWFELERMRRAMG